MSDYWNDCISEALNDVGLEATPEQVDAIAGFVEVSHDNYGMAYGHDAIPNPLLSEIGRQKGILKQSCEQYDTEISRLKKDHEWELARLRSIINELRSKLEATP